jgi:hypothetical protein
MMTSPAIPARTCICLCRPPLATQGLQQKRHKRQKVYRQARGDTFGRLCRFCRSPLRLVSGRLPLANHTHAPRKTKCFACVHVVLCARACIRD